LAKCEQNYSTIEKEALAAVSAVKDFYPNLYDFYFTLLTDHNPLTSLKGMKEVEGRLLGGYSFCNSSILSSSTRPGNMLDIKSRGGSRIFRRGVLAGTLNSI